jgi:hypothetical protein
MFALGMQYKIIYCSNCFIAGVNNVYNAAKNYHSVLVTGDKLSPVSLLPGKTFVRCCFVATCDRLWDTT